MILQTIVADSVVISLSTRAGLFVVCAPFWYHNFFKEVEDFTAVVAVFLSQICIPIVVHDANPLQQRVQFLVPMVHAECFDAATVVACIKLFVLVDFSAFN